MRGALLTVAALLALVGVWDLTDAGALLFGDYVRVQRAACEARHEIAEQTGTRTTGDCGPPNPVHGVGWLVASGVAVLFAGQMRRNA